MQICPCMITNSQVVTGARVIPEIMSYFLIHFECHPGQARVSARSSSTSCWVGLGMPPCGTYTEPEAPHRWKRTGLPIMVFAIVLVTPAVLLSITRNCPCVVSRSQQNNSRSRFVSFPSLSVQNQPAGGKGASHSL
jgi:hypothetical protein